MLNVATFAVASAAVLALTVPSARAEFTAATQNGVTVTVKYTGKGTVDATHKIWVWLFLDPNIGPGSIPIAEESIDKNGGTASFANVTGKQVYVAVAYDEAGGFGGNAPPPPGSPIAMYGVKAPDDKPAAVVPGAKSSVSITFDDTQRMQ
jgi:hypothetical protein